MTDNNPPLTFVVPCPPSTNALYANVRGKGRRKTERYRIWRQAAGWAMRLDGNTPRTWDTITGPVTVDIVNGNKRMDTDNGGKGICDLLVDMAVIKDDKQVVAIGIAQGGNHREAVVTVRRAA